MDVGTNRKDRVMSLNIELAEQILTQITEHPETHDQSFWHCGTTMCIAGFACHFAGDSLVVRNRVSPNSVLLADGSEELISIRARNLLGLESTSIFYLSDEVDAVKQLRELIAEAKAQPAPVA